MLSRKFLGLACLCVTLLSVPATEGHAQGPLTQAAKGFRKGLAGLDPTTHSGREVIQNATVGIPLATHIMPVVTTTGVVTNIGRGKSIDAPLPVHSSHLSEVQPRPITIVLPSNGRLSKNADGSWVEIGANGQFVSRFRELSWNGSVVVLREDNRRFNLTIPMSGGQIIWQFDGQVPTNWGIARIE
jgi:hypothetical protein